MDDRARLETPLNNTVWTNRPVDWLWVVALVGICLDAVTTWYVLSSDRYLELNPVLDGLWSIHPLLVGAYFVGMGVVVAVGIGRVGWLSTVISAYVIVVIGIFGGLNNLELFAFGGPGLLDVLAESLHVSGATLIKSIVPACGLCVSLGAARFRHGPLPWREVTAATVGAVVVYTASVGVVLSLI